MSTVVDTIGRRLRRAVLDLAEETPRTRALNSPSPFFSHNRRDVTDEPEQPK